MAKLSDLTVTVDRFFTDTRLTSCMEEGCKYNTGKGAWKAYKGDSEYHCRLKKIGIGPGGQCHYVEVDEAST